MSDGTEDDITRGPSGIFSIHMYIPTNHGLYNMKG